MKSIIGEWRSGSPKQLTVYADLRLPTPTTTVSDRTAGLGCFTTDPTRHGVPRGTVSHAAWYPTRHRIPRGTVSHAACCSFLVAVKNPSGNDPYTGKPAIS